jgi:phosphoribosylpyrophosphate synthetase
MENNPFNRSINNEPVYPLDSEKSKDFLLFSGSANPSLAKDISTHLSKPLSSITLDRFADGECNIQIQESVRGKNVYIIHQHANQLMIT